MNIEKLINEAKLLHKRSYGFKPINSLNSLLKAKYILNQINYPKNEELYIENERLINNYKNKLGIKQ